MTKQWAASCGALLLAGCSALPSSHPESISAQPRLLEFSNPPRKQGTPCPVTATFAVVGNSLEVHFKVVATAIFAKPQLAADEYPYEYDVVELFVSNAKSGTPSYYEFEVSPYNQSLQVNVVAPRQEYHFGVKNGFTHSARITSDGWEADMKIPLAAIGWDGKRPVQFTGNAYAALGDAGHRIYWSLFELPVGKPDFHVPSAFRPLFGN